MRIAASGDLCSCFYAIAPEFVTSFAEEYFRQHADIFADYDFGDYKRQTDSMLAGCLQSYAGRLTERERQSYVALSGEREQTAFRIAQSLSRCESEATLPPPLFCLSAEQLGTRLGAIPMTAWRILKAFEKCGILKTERPGTLRTKGQKGIATVYRWMLSPKD